MGSTAPTSQTNANASTDGVKAFYGPVQPYLEGIKSKIQAIVPPESMLLAESLAHSLTGGGKLLRPVVTMLASAASATPVGSVTDAHQEVAAVAEMIHVATLLHDDVLDDADLRRGKPTVRSQWGNTVAILSGDYLLAQASRKLAQVGNIRVVAIFSDVLADLCDGEVEQIRTSFNLAQTTWDTYYRKSICKTATLFAAGCEAAAVLNGLPEAQVQGLRTYGKNFGVAFQIVDDLLDYTSTEAAMGKPVMDDLRNGIVNAPVLLALESDCLTASEKNDLRGHVAAIFEGGEAVPGHIAQVRRLLEKADAIADTQRLAERFIEEAIGQIAFLANSEEKDALIGLGRFVIDRNH